MNDQEVGGFIELALTKDSSKLNELAQSVEDGHPFHNKEHSAFVEQQATYWAEQLGLSEIDQNIAQIAGKFHDLIVKDGAEEELIESGVIVKDNLTSEQRGTFDEIASALSLGKKLDELAENSELRNSEAYQEIKRKILTSILSTALNRSKAAPPEYKGESLIKQFYLIDNLDSFYELQPKLMDLLEQVFDVNSKEELQTILSQAKKEKHPALAVCLADLSHFAAEDEDIFWKFSIRYVIETLDVESAESISAESLRNFYGGQEAYFNNYLNNLPGSVPEKVKILFRDRMKINIQRMNVVLEKDNSELMVWWHKMYENHLYIKD
jgi:hypothetical protein